MRLLIFEKEWHALASYHPQLLSHTRSVRIAAQILECLAGARVRNEDSLLQNLELCSGWSGNYSLRD